MAKGFPPGVSGNPKGRPKNIEDKRTKENNKYYDTLAKLRAMGYDPVESMVELARDTGEDRKLRFLADKELMARIAPTVKSIQVQGDLSEYANLESLREIATASLERNKKDH